MDLSLLGERIKKARIEKRYTLEKLSEEIGISRNFLWEIEAGRKAPAIQTLYNISKTLNLSVDYVFDLSQKSKWLHSEAEDILTTEIYRILNKMDSKEIKIIYKLLETYLSNK